MVIAFFGLYGKNIFLYFFWRRCLVRSERGVLIAFFWSVWQKYFHIFIMREIKTVIAFLWHM